MKSLPIQAAKIGMLAGCLAATAGGGGDAAASFFEKEVLPILKEACFDCHSHRIPSAKGGLYLDSRPGWETGGNSGAAIIPGNPDASLLIRAVRYTDENLQMPPDGKRLSAPQVAVLEKWVRSGAADARQPPPETEEALNAHWAFQPVRMPPLPQVRNSAWAKTAVDWFVLRRLEDLGMQPSTKMAEKAVLIRRVYFDLIGLPPSLEEIQRFESDRSPNAFERLVDRLLASPQYGERWARHWLDVARYADTKGYVFQEERRFLYAYTYRDYVVDAFNRDLPYDRFIIEQLAADRLNLGENPQPLAGMGFLTLGRRFLNNQPDIVDDRIDVTTRGLMGLTVSCARCHNHKYDPIPTADYYSLYGVFASSREPDERPLLHSDPNSSLYQNYRAELERRTTKWENYRVSNQRAALSKARKQTGDYLKASYDARHANRSETENLVRERRLGPVIAFRWQDFFEELGERFDPVFTPWVQVAKPNSPAQSTSGIIQQTLTANPPLNPVLVAALQKRQPSSAAELAAVYGELFEKAETDWLAIADKADALADPGWEALRQELYRDGAPPNIPLTQATQLLDVPTQEKIRALKREVDRLSATHPGAPARAMSLIDRENLVEPTIFLRGKADAPGPKVPRQFLSLLTGEDRVPFADGSGRLELARAIASPDNPLTSRVIVNRVWRHHFGQPLVGTPSDFGTRAEPPSHPDLLDYLASRLVASGWSLKSLHRLILHSSAYQQSSDFDEWYAAQDPDNRWLWRMNRRRLELEPLRDTMLWVSGSLDAAMGGQPVEIAQPPFVPRRTIYGFIERQNLPDLFRTFDLANPDSSSPGRFETTVPQQALFLANNPFVQDLARKLEARVLRDTAAGTGSPVQTLFETVLQRLPTHAEKQLALDFLHSQSEAEPPLAAQAGRAADNAVPPMSPLARLCQALLMSNELAFVD